MMVAGIGCRKGAAHEDILSAIETALEAHGLAVTALTALATATLKRDEPGILSAARQLDLPLLVVDDAALAAVASRTLSHSQASQQAAGTPSVSEAAALAAAGTNATLLGPRTIVGPATCAIATSGATA
ncbi:cobalamin biosynthesis protein [Aminobacter carboxidus]|uniref:Cobalamin biosynthesis protein n=1 Tax=Aminobacter carboxidus TaxID=376165 RepID=A0A8E1WAY7_9HYPH|nr:MULTISPECIES: cobalamin biosynthesis protein [Aminobacter carboxidus group]MBB6464653.1 cobalt-precorrin 5A hydrolase [Aminobacter lissarensis]MBE1206837.1 cobalamin biosynthesis protein [Aminobacter carboxidus]